MNEEKGIQEPADAAIAVNERMDHLELGMDEPEPNEWRVAFHFGVDISLQLRNRSVHFARGRRYK